MDSQDGSQKIKEIYDEAVKKLESLGLEHKTIIQGYLKELEAQKIAAIRQSLEADLSK